MTKTRTRKAKTTTSLLEAPALAQVPPADALDTGGMPQSLTEAAVSQAGAEADSGDTTVVLDVDAMVALAADASVAPGPWPNRRALFTCPTCGEEHQHPFSFAARARRRGAPLTAQDRSWFLAHLVAAGIRVEAKA